MKILTIVLLALFPALVGLAQDVSPVEEDVPDPLLDCYVPDHPTEAAVAEIEAQTEDAELKGYAVYASHAWKTDRLNVTFASNAPQVVRQGVAKLMVQWNPYSRVKFYPSDAAFEKGDIRVSFGRDLGNNSEIGRLASRLPTSSATMNLATCVKWPVSSRQFRRVVLHEFGHALGFAHEHQHPNDNCSAEIEWDKAYLFYKKHHGWKTKKVDDNLRTIANRSGMILSPRGDASSVMRYFLHPSILKNGKTSRCFADEMFDLSSGDKAGAERLYPSGSGFGAGGMLEKLVELKNGNDISAATGKLIDDWAAYWAKQ